MRGQRILVTGASGYLGRQVVARLADPALADRPACVVAHDIRTSSERLPGVVYEEADIRDPRMADIIERHGIDTVVHLASIVTPGKGSRRDFEYDVDVNGTRNVLQACVRHGVRRIVVSSSGAAYGYHADNAAWLTEDMPVRGNEVFAYAHHKRLVEEMLAQYRAQHPALEQVVLRIGTILGERVDNQITALFERPRPLAVRGSDSPFVFVWDEDVVGAILHAIAGGPAGVYNLAGDGVLTMPEIAARLGKRCRVLPAWLLQGALAIAQPLGLTRYGPEQVRFLRWRPVLDNTRLKTVFGYVPRHSSAQAFDRWAATRCASR